MSSVAPELVAADRLAGFPVALRSAGLAVDPSRAITFLRAVNVVELRDIADLSRTGRVTLVGTPEDFPTFDAVFRDWFGAGPSTVVVPLSDDEEQVPPSDRPRSEESLVEMIEGDGAGQTAADDHLRNRKAFGHQPEHARALLARLKPALRRLPSLTSRHWTPSPRGLRIDLARTARAARRTFGETLRILRQTRPQKPRRLLILIDVSGSMKAQSEANLRLAHFITAQRRHVETFCFGTRLSRVTKTLKRRDADDALQRLAGIVFDFDGGTRIGPSLETFLSVSRHAALVRGAITIVISDGLERGDPAAMVHAVARLARLSRRLFWATPLAADPRYRPATRAMAAILPSLDALVDASGYASFEPLLHRLEAVGRGPRGEAWRSFEAPLRSAPALTSG